jgi:CRISPR-associated protein Csm2
MVSFYKNPEKRMIEPQLFSKIAEEIAEKVHSSGGRDSNKRSQLRKFFDEVIRLNSMAKSSPDDWDNILPYVNMLLAKVVYAEGRKKVTGEFVDLIKNCIKQVKSPDDLDVFANFFEAFMGFYRKYNEN